MVTRATTLSNTLWRKVAQNLVMKRFENRPIGLGCMARLYFDPCGVHSPVRVTSSTSHTSGSQIFPHCASAVTESDWDSGCVRIVSDSFGRTFMLHPGKGTEPSDISRKARWCGSQPVRYGLPSAVNSIPLESTGCRRCGTDPCVPAAIWL